VRLLQVVPAYASYDVFLRELAEAAVTVGHPTAVVCGGIPKRTDSVDGGGVRLLPLDIPRGSNAARHWRAARALRRIVEDWRADVVHAHFSAGMFTTALALRRGDPWISFGTFQGLAFPMSREPKRSLVRAAETFAARRFDRTHVLTTDDLRALRRAAPSAPVEVQGGFGFGCADRFLDTPRPSGEQRRGMRRAAGVPEEASVLIFVGRQVAFKGFDLAVRTFWRLKQDIPLVRLVTVGSLDPLHPTGLSPAEWRRYHDDREIVRAQTQRDVMPWLDMADLMLFPTEREGMPVCVMEALARDLPVVTAPVRGCRELVFDGQNGFLIADRAESVWAERIATLLRRPRPLLPRADRDLCHRLRRSLWVADTLTTYKEALAASVPRLPALNVKALFSKLDRGAG
jgi:glycosyltransferase involved in cell wall biosynthesis